MKLYDKYKTLLQEHGVTTPLRIAHFFCQIEHESNLMPIAENMHYSAAGLRKAFPKYFPTLQLANQYANKPEKIGNRVYANRMGNGDEQSGEGYKYRGRGFIQITGKENYFHLHIDTDLDCVKNPDLLLEEANAMVSALWFWNLHQLNIYADMDNIKTITKRINGGLTGYDDRVRLLNKYKEELKVK